MKGKFKKISLWTITAIVAIFASVYGINRYIRADELIDGKELRDNGDGTYELSLSVTGESEKKVNKANVVVILDISGSMNNPVKYEIKNTGRYGLVNNEYVNLYYRYSNGWRYVYDALNNDTYTGEVYYINNGQYTQYTNDRYVASETRLDAAKSAVNGLANSLLNNNTSENNDIIEIALVTFSNKANTAQNATTSYSSFSSTVNNLTANGGTNWEAALQQAKNVSFGANDKDTTYVIFVSDGNPTFHSTNGGYGNYNSQYDVYGTGYEDETNIQRSYDQAKDDAKALVDAGYKFYTIGIYGNVNRMKDITTYSGVSATDNYFSAEDTAKLQSALDTILKKIETAGIGEVSVEDGTTQSVSTESGELNLLTVDYTDEDNNSFRYWLSFPVTSSGTDSYTGKVNNMNAVITKNSDGKYTCKWGENNEFSLVGTVENNIFKYEWTGANDLYNREAPKATLSNSKVNWNLKELDVLLNGVTYTVTFNVWPSQETYDLISDLDNGIITYDSLDDDVKKVLVKNGNNYSLLTNTRATLTYTDTRNEDGEQVAVYKNPDPVSTKDSKMTVNKLWENDLDKHQNDVTKVELNVLKDGSKYGKTITLTKDSNDDWKSEVFISAGLMSVIRDSNGNVTSVKVREKGHDYTFQEIEDGTYYWDLVVETVRPMIVNENNKLVLKTFVKVTENAPVIGDSNVTVVDGVTYYKIDGSVYYVRETNAAILNATNVRRSNLNITKVVTGESAPEDSLFTFDLTVNDYLGNDVWFSIYDPKTGTVKDDKYVSADGLEKEYTNGEFNGYYNVKSGTKISVSMQANWNLRFTNLPTGSTYIFEEKSMPENFAFVNAKATEVSSRVDLLPNGAVDNGDGTYTYNNVTYKKVTENGNVYYTYTGKASINGKVVSGKIFVGNTSYTVTYTNDYLKTELNGSKVWSDSDNQDGKRPSEIKVKVIAKVDNEVIDDLGTVVTIPSNNTNRWSFKIAGLDRYYDGKVVSYSIEELDIDGYTSNITVDNDGNYIITNTHEIEKTSVTTSKVWSDKNNQDGIRPDSITINLLANGSKVDSCTATKEDNYACVFADLDKYANGSEIKYTITEDAVAGYTSSISGYTVTNTHGTDVTSVTTSKVWVDNNNQDGKRPDSITINLLANGSKVDSCTATKEDNYVCVFTDLDKYANGSEIKYTITEEAVAGYTSSIDGYTVTNTYEIEKISVNGKKSWVDSNNIEGLRPESITVRLLANGEEIANNIVKANEDGEWNYSFTNLDKYANGSEIKYTVTEDTVDKYETTYDEKNPYIIINTHSPKNIVMSVKKVWVDESVDGIKNIYGHNDSIDIRLVGKVGETIYYDKTETLSNDNEWKFTFSDLPEYRDGKLISYSFEEVTDVKNYSVKQSNVGNDYTFTNTYTPKTTSISGVKTWKDESNNDGIRPTSIELTLTDNHNNVIASKNVTSDDEWKYEFNNLPLYDNEGNEIKYTLTESSVTGYTSVVENYNVTNTHVLETVSFDITKVWNDNDNNDGFRPESVTVRLLANGKEVDSAIISEETGWAYKFENLNKYEAGKPIKYTLVEDEVSEYTSEIKPTSDNSFEVINTHIDETTEVTITKTWDDMDDVSEIRPDSITVYLYADGEEVQTIVISKDDNWVKTITDLPKYSNGNEIEYSIDEKDVFEYEKEINGFDIINRHELGIGGGPEEEPPQTGVVYTNNKSMIYLILLLISLLNITVMFVKEN